MDNGKFNKMRMDQKLLQIKGEENSFPWKIARLIYYKYNYELLSERKNFDL